jgi:D-alanine transaminase
MAKVIYLNSKYVKFRDAKIHIEDRGLQFSDSVYEVVSFYNRNLIDFKFHIERLRYSLKELDIKYRINIIKLKNIFENLIIKNNIKSGIIYLQITRGVQQRNHSYKDKYIPNIIIYARRKKFNLPGVSLLGEKAITTEDLRWKRRDIKSVSLLPNILAKKIADQKGAYEAILVEKGKITEGCSSNVWMVKNKFLITHPLNTDILKGVTRETLKKLINLEKLKLNEKKFSKEQLYKADEVFITSASCFVTPIIKIDNIKINKGKIGPITRKLSEIYFGEINSA